MVPKSGVHRTTRLVEGYFRSVGVLNPNSRGHTEAWESFTQLEGGENGYK